MHFLAKSPHQSLVSPLSLLFMQSAEQDRGKLMWFQAPLPTSQNNPGVVGPGEHVGGKRVGVTLGTHVWASDGLG